MLKAHSVIKACSEWCQDYDHHTFGILLSAFPCFLATIKTNSHPPTRSRQCKLSSQSTFTTNSVWASNSQMHFSHFHKINRTSDVWTIGAVCCSTLALGCYTSPSELCWNTKQMNLKLSSKQTYDKHYNKTTTTNYSKKNKTYQRKKSQSKNVPALYMD